MDWIQFIIFIGSIVGLFFWNRSESRTDIRHMDYKLEENRRETNNKIEEWRKETNTILEAIRQDIKDFHSRLEKQDAEFKAHMIYLHHKNES